MKEGLFLGMIEMYLSINTIDKDFDYIIYSYDIKQHMGYSSYAAYLLSVLSDHGPHKSLLIYDRVNRLQYRLMVHDSSNYTIDDSGFTLNLNYSMFNKGIKYYHSDYVLFDIGYMNQCIREYKLERLEL